MADGINLEIIERQSTRESDRSTDQGIRPPMFRSTSVSHRRATEIQLETLLKERECFLPYFIRQATESLPPDKILSIEEIAKMLNTQVFILERLICVLNCSSTNENLPPLNRDIIQRLTRALTSTIDVRCLVFFKMLDTDRDQYIGKEELSSFYERYLNNMESFNKNIIPKVICILLKKFHLDTDRRIDFDEFYSIVTTDKSLLNSFYLFSVSPIWFVNQKTAQSHLNLIQRFFARLSHQDDVSNEYARKSLVDKLRDNLPRVMTILLYILINIALIVYVAIYRAVVIKAPVFIVFARISGMLLDFHCSLILVLMLKQTILLIRTTKLYKWLPIDDHIDFHKFVGRYITVLAVIHTVAHMINFARQAKYPWPIYMFTTRPDIGWIEGFAPLSGVILCIILSVIIICSMQWIRRGGYFKVFYWTHLLYIPFFIFLILHAKNFWKWVIGPFTIFVLEKIYSMLTRYSAGRGRTYLLSATIEQSNVISLMIRRSKYFNFKPGDYIMINLPRVALYEFHPFTISSAPEEGDYIRVHIQAVGNWTKRVYQYFKQLSDRHGDETHIKVFRADTNIVPSTCQELIRRNTIQEIEDEQNQVAENNTSSPSLPTSEPVRKHKEVIIIKGPYSSCARYIFDSKHVILICSGIGITPYASILSSLMAQFRASRRICKHCHRFNYNDDGLWANYRLKKVDFIWTNRDSKSFEWFLNLLREFEKEQEEYLALNQNEHRFLNIQLYSTAINGGKSIDNFFLHHLTNMWSEETGIDVFTGLRSPTRFGRPVWEDLFQDLMANDRGWTAADTKVFFCGLKTMGKIIRQHCANLGIHYYEEKF